MRDDPKCGCCRQALTRTAQGDWVCENAKHIEDRPCRLFDQPVTVIGYDEEERE